jgi:recombination protein RecR
VAQLSQSVIELIEQLSRLPGIGRRSAERIAYHLLRVGQAEALALADAIQSVRKNVRYCSECFHLSEQATCELCSDSRRDRTQLCVVEQSRDVLALEDSGQFRGVYHVLLGRISPLERVGPDDLTIDALVRRVSKAGFKEVILATNPTVEGDGTALHISNLLSPFGVSITKLARGITSGSVLEHTNKEILADALAGRRPI